MILMNAVLVATDFGETSNAALIYGRNLARTFGARLYVLHVAEKVHAATGEEFFPGDIDALQAEVGYSSLDRGAKSDLAAGKPYGHFFSLRGPEPSALVESLFLSNPTEAALLHDDATLDALADGCTQGVLEYFATLD